MGIINQIEFDQSVKNFSIRTIFFLPPHTLFSNILSCMNIDKCFKHLFQVAHTIVVFIIANENFEKHCNEDHKLLIRS